MTSHSTVSKPGTSRGRSASVSGSVSSSLRQGIWMISFMRTTKDGTARVRLVDSHGGLDAHPATHPNRLRTRSTELGRAWRPPGQDPLRAPVPGLRDRVLRVPDIPGLRLVLLPV